MTRITRFCDATAPIIGALRRARDAAAPFMRLPPLRGVRQGGGVSFRRADSRNPAGHDTTRPLSYRIKDGAWPDSIYSAICGHHRHILQHELTLFRIQCADNQGPRGLSKAICSKQSRWSISDEARIMYSSSPLLLLFPEFFSGAAGSKGERFSRSFAPN